MRKYLAISVPLRGNINNDEETEMTYENIISRFRPLTGKYK